MTTRVDVRKVELAEHKANCADDSFDEWESSRLDELAYDYPEDILLISGPNAMAYRAESAAARRATDCSRSVTHG